MVWLLSVLALAAAVPAGKADVKANPYQTIVERNPFGLKPPPPPPDPTPVQTEKPPSAIELTGITSILSSKRALLEITEPGKPVKRPILAEGERLDGVEVLAIDIQKNQVTVKNGTVVTNIALKAPSKATGPAAPGAPPVPATTALPHPPAGTQPGALPGSSATSSGRNSVVVVGGASGTGVTPSSPVSAGFTPSGNVSVSDGSGLRAIPPRVPRTGTVQPQGQIDPAQQAAQILLMKQEAAMKGHPFPPFPGLDGVVNQLDQQPPQQAQPTQRR